jgi:2-hydroxychromene-2-carboxylate isomerase
VIALPAPPLVHHEHPAPWRQDVAALPRQRTDGDVRTGVAVLYGSFACPWSYLASQRADHITTPALHPAWRMIDPRAAPGTRLSAPGSRLDRQGAEAAVAELEAVRALLLPGEHLPARPPPFVPHAGPAVVGYAEAVGAGVGQQVRRVLFDAYWQQGLDIGLPEVLRRILEAPLRAGSSAARSVAEHGYAVTLTGGPITTDAHLRMLAWHTARPATLADGLPTLVADGISTSGRAALAALAARQAS